MFDKRILLVYIAGPYRAEDVVGVKRNIERAEQLAMEMTVKCDGRVYPVIPHCNTKYWEGLMPGEFFIDGTKELMRRCDAVLIVPDFQSSEGTLGEIAEAEKLSIPVFFNIHYLEQWLKKG